MDINVQSLHWLGSLTYNVINYYIYVALNIQVKSVLADNWSIGREIREDTGLTDTPIADTAWCNSLNKLALLMLGL